MRRPCLRMPIKIMCSVNFISPKQNPREVLTCKVCRSRAMPQQESLSVRQKRVALRIPSMCLRITASSGINIIRTPMFSEDAKEKVIPFHPERLANFNRHSMGRAMRVPSIGNEALEFH
jgi:hypothetical protein